MMPRSGLVVDFWNPAGLLRKRVLLADSRQLSQSHFLTAMDKEYLGACSGEVTKPVRNAVILMRHPDC
jgi:hypothetical protein